MSGTYNVSEGQIVVADGKATRSWDGVEVDATPELEAAIVSAEASHTQTIVRQQLIARAKTLRDDMYTLVIDTALQNRDPAEVARVETEADDLLSQAIGLEEPKLTELIGEISALALKGTRERVAAGV